MPWLDPVLSFIGGLLETLVAPIASYFTGKEVQERKQAEEVLDDVAKANAAKYNSKLRDSVHEEFK